MFAGLGTVPVARTAKAAGRYHGKNLALDGAGRYRIVVIIVALPPTGTGGVSFWLTAALGIHRLGVGLDMPGIDGMSGIGDMLGMFSIGIFMFFIMDAQQSFDWVVGALAFIME